MPQGNWREVHLIGDVAVKVPRSDRPAEMQRQAMLLNLWEHEMWTVWRPKFGWPHLCPVLWCDPTGSTLVMRRGSPNATVAEVDAMLGRFYPDVTCETKLEDWGHLDGRLVVIDYGPAGWTEEDIQKHRDDYADKAGAAPARR
jgi:hypothetical protein